jgi:hypothetical protein
MQFIPDRRTTIALLVVAALVGCTFVLIFRPAADPMSDILKLLIGALIANATSVIGYDFGSSKGSEDKQDMIGRLLKSPESK